ncbi:MAG: hypothetical protein QN178_06905 [Armatimonadota bacterium]|nr:hypothetical protein [Armatimonadota bacterium]
MSAPRRSTESRPSRLALLVVAAVAVVAGIVVAVVHFATQTPAPVATPAGPAPLEPGGKTRGRADAPVTIEVYSDFL